MLFGCLVVFVRHVQAWACHMLRPWRGCVTFRGTLALHGQRSYAHDVCSHLNLKSVRPCPTLERIYGSGLEVRIARASLDPSNTFQLAHAGHRAFERKGDLVDCEATGAVEIVAS